jgi:hypothetical protein
MSKVVKKIGRAVKKVVKGVGKVFKKIKESKIFKAIAIAAAVYFTGGAALGAMGGASAGFGASMAAGNGFLASLGAGLSGAVTGAAAGLGSAWAGLSAAGGAFAAGEVAAGFSALGSGITGAFAAGSGAVSAGLTGLGSLGQAFSSGFQATTGQITGGAAAAGQSVTGQQLVGEAGSSGLPGGTDLGLETGGVDIGGIDAATSNMSAPPMTQAPSGMAAPTSVATPQPINVPGMPQMGPQNLLKPDPLNAMIHNQTGSVFAPGGGVFSTPQAVFQALTQCPQPCSLLGRYMKAREWKNMKKRPEGVETAISAPASTDNRRLLWKVYCSHNRQDSKRRWQRGLVLPRPPAPLVLLLRLLMIWDQRVTRAIRRS